MRRRLIVLRHAKSAWDTDAATDHERPLNKRGRRDALRVAEKIAKLGWQPEQVISSDAERTRETWKGGGESSRKRPRGLFVPSSMDGLDQLQAGRAAVGRRSRRHGHWPNPAGRKRPALVGKEVSITT